MTNSEFHKRMTVSDLETNFREENCKFLSVQVFHKECYGFDLGNTEEHATARQIILDKNNFIYTGWKVARKLANWIRNSDEWTEFHNKKKSVENHDNDVLINDINDDKRNVEESYCHGDDESVHGNSNSEYDEDNSNDHDNYDDYDDDMEEEEEKDYDGFVNESKMKTFEYVAKSSKSNNAKNIKSTCGDNLDTKLSESSMSGDDQIFKSICGGDLKKKLADTAVNHFKQNSVVVHITGLLHHSGKSHWVVVHGENKEAFMLKAQFISVYISCLLRDWVKVTNSNINTDHCKTYYDIGICKHQFGSESLWKHAGEKKSPVKKIPFVYSYDTKIGDTAGKEELMDAIKFFFVSMKECVDNPIGPLLLDYLQEKKENIYDYFIKKATKMRILPQRNSHV
jgi:hypothetical protein